MHQEDVVLQTGSGTKVEDLNNISTGSTFKELSASLLKNFKINVQLILIFKFRMPEACHWLTSSPDSYTISRTPCPFVYDSKQYSRHVRRPLPAYLHCEV